MTNHYAHELFITNYKRIMQHSSSFTEYTYSDVVQSGMKNITAATLGSKFGNSYRINVTFNEELNTFTKTLQKNNLFHHSHLEHWHANDKILDKFLYMNQLGKKKLSLASQYEVNGTGLIYMIPYEVWKKKGKNNENYRYQIYKLE